MSLAEAREKAGAIPTDQLAQVFQRVLRAQRSDELDR